MLTHQLINLSVGRRLTSPTSLTSECGSAVELFIQLVAFAIATGSLINSITRVADYPRRHTFSCVLSFSSTLSGIHSLYLKICLSTAVSLLYHTIEFISFSIPSIQLIQFTCSVVFGHEGVPGNYCSILEETLREKSI